MQASGTAERQSRLPNALGFLRLLFASLVIASHVPELVDGNRDREVLTRITGHITLGYVAVCGFFIISGFLISKSYNASRTIGGYLFKRIARIYPAFIAASLVCLVIAAPMAGAAITRLSLHNILATIARMALLARPVVYGAFPGQHYNDPHSALDGPMWTIQYEFACYLLVILLGLIGSLRQPIVLATLSCCSLLFGALMPATGFNWLSHPDLFAGTPSIGPVLTGMFLAGATFASLKDRVRITRFGMVLAAILLTSSLTVEMVAPFGLAIGGTYLIFAFAQSAGQTALGRINAQNDISYGVYLYGWPVEQLLIKYGLAGSLWLLGGATWLIAAALGAASWHIVEKRLKR